jgi:hypothetical protein
MFKVYPASPLLNRRVVAAESNIKIKMLNSPTASILDPPDYPDYPDVEPLIRTYYPGLSCNTK